jgi:hypothetical protein
MIFHRLPDAQLFSSDAWGQTALDISAGHLNGTMAGLIQAQSRTKRTTHLLNRKRWGSGRRTLSIQLRLCADKTAHTMSLSSSISRNLSLKKPGELQSGKAGNHIMLCVIIAMMLFMISYVRLAPVSWLNQQNNTSLTIGSMPYWGQAIRLLNTRLYPYACTKCHSANWRQGYLPVRSGPSKRRTACKG